MLLADPASPPRGESSRDDANGFGLSREPVHPELAQPSYRSACVAEGRLVVAERYVRLRDDDPRRLGCRPLPLRGTDRPRLRRRPDGVQARKASRRSPHVRWRTALLLRNRSGDDRAHLHSESAVEARRVARDLAVGEDHGCARPVLPELLRRRDHTQVLALTDRHRLVLDELALRATISGDALLASMPS